MPFFEPSIQFHSDLLIRECQLILEDLYIMEYFLEAGLMPRFPPSHPIVNVPDTPDGNSAIINNSLYQSEWSESTETLVDEGEDSPFMDSFDFDPVITSETEDALHHYYRAR
jgi:hypothetical protein